MVRCRIRLARIVWAVVSSCAMESCSSISCSLAIRSSRRSRSDMAPECTKPLMNLQSESRPLVQVRRRCGLDRLGAPPKGATDVQEKRSDEAQGQEKPGKGEGPAGEVQGPGEGRAFAPRARLQAGGEALPGRTQELLSLKLLDPIALGGGVGQRLI